MYVYVLCTLLTAGPIVVCCKIDAVFWTPVCEEKQQWRKETWERKDLIVLTIWNIWNFSKFKCKSTFGICRSHRLWLWFLQMLSEAHIALQAAHQARSGFVYCQRGWRFSHCKYSAGSRTVGWIRMPLLSHDSLWQQPQLPRSAVNLGWDLNDSCGHAELQQCSHNAVLTTTGWHHNLVWTLVHKVN